MSSRENILNRLKTARENRPEQSFPETDFGLPIYHEQKGSLADWFQENLELIGGKILRTKNLDEAIDRIAALKKDEPWERLFCADPHLQKALNGKIDFWSDANDFPDLQIGLTPCEFLVAHLGSVMVSSGGVTGRRLHVFPETHIVVAHQRQLVKFLDDAMEAIQAKYHGNLPSAISNITGPSRTADIEKTLVMGMHGPKNLIVMLCDEPF